MPPICNSLSGLQLASSDTEDTTGGLFSQLVTTIGPRCLPPPCKKTFGKNGFFRPGQKTEELDGETGSGRFFPRARPTAPAHRTFLAGHQQNRGCGQPSNDWMEPSIQIQKLDEDFDRNPKIGRRLQSKSKNWTKEWSCCCAPTGPLMAWPVSLRKTLINCSKPRGTPAPTEPLLQNIIEISGIGQM